jgi:hypothetical protein
VGDGVFDVVWHVEGRRRTPPPLYLRSRNESPPLSWRRASEFFRLGQRVAERLCDEFPPHPPEERMVVLASEDGRPSPEARASNLHWSSRRVHDRPSVSRGLRPLMGS